MSTRAIASDETIIDGQAEDITALKIESDEDEKAILADFGAAQDRTAWVIKIYKRGEGKSRPWVTDISPSQLPYMAKLRKLAGPGNYIGYCYRGPKIAHTIKWEILELNADVEEKSASENSPLFAAVRGMMETQRELVAQLAAMKAAPPVATAPQSSMSEMMHAMVEMMAIMKPERDRSPPPPPLDPLAMMGTIVGMAKDLAGADREKSTLEVVGDLLSSPTVQEILGGVLRAQQQQPQIPAGVPRPRIPAPQIQLPPGAPQQTQPAAGMDVTAAPFSAEIAFLLQGAQKNIDPVSYADVIGGLMDEAQMQALLSLPDPVGMLIATNPNIEPFRPWFEEVFAALTDEGEEDDNGEDATGRSSAPVEAD